MTKSESNRSIMFQALLNILERYISEIQKIPIFAEYLSHFKALFQELKEKNDIYLNVKKGTTDGKERCSKELIDELVQKANILYLLARKINNDNLKAISHQTESSLKRLRDSDLLHLAKIIYNSLNENLPNLSDFKFDANTLQSLGTKLTNYESALTIQGTNQAVGKASRKELKNVFKRIDDVLKNELDKAIEMIKSVNVSFYNEYKAARIIKDLGQTKSNKTEKTKINHQTKSVDNPYPGPG